MSASLTILILLILVTAAVWVFTQNKLIKSMLYPVNQLLLYLLFWKIAGPVFAHLFLIVGFLIVIALLLLSSENEPEKNTRPKLRLKHVISLGTIALYIITSLLVFINAAGQAEPIEFPASMITADFSELAWIYIILMALLSIQLYILLKGVFKTDE
ncbi:MAG: hypothetical protein Q7J65_02405 [Candidatus Marinimicrobia bacterium]|nr:hypothetical protein [Candidatus Neomarinimicrobiota bacterium]